MTPAVGETRVCPHCKATILKSAAICPACQHYLRYDAVRASGQEQATFCPLRVAGTIRHPNEGDAWEYSVVLEVQDEAGKVISNQVMGVGALHPAETRTFTIRLEVLARDKTGF